MNNHVFFCTTDRVNLILSREADEQLTPVHVLTYASVFTYALSIRFKDEEVVVVEIIE